MDTADFAELASCELIVVLPLRDADKQNYWVGVSTPVFQDLIGWRLYPMHAFFCALSFVLVYFCKFRCSSAIVMLT